MMEPKSAVSRSRYQVEELVEKRLRSSWGRPTTAHHNRTVTSTMHQMISEIPDDRISSSEHDRVERLWKEVEQRCKTHPREAGQMDCRGRTCLHVVCTKNPPVSVVTALIAASVRSSEAVRERDKHGNTPLALAVTSQNSSRCSVAVIRRLLLSCPRAAAVSDHHGFLPLHIVCQHYHEKRQEIVEALLEAYPQGAARECNSGCAPLHCAIEGGHATLVLVVLLTQACPESVLMNGCGTNPLFLAIRRKCIPDLILALIHANSDVTTTRDQYNGFPLRRAVEQNAPLEVLRALMVTTTTISPYAVVMDIDFVTQDTVMHSELECGIPDEDMARLLLEAAPQVALCPSRYGKTPLSIACRRFLSTDPRHRTKALWNSFSLFLRAAWYNRIDDNDPILHAAVGLGLPVGVIDVAMRLHPEQISQRDQNESFPLHLALVAVSSPQIKDDKTQLVLSMLEAHPEAATMPTRQGQTTLIIAAGVRPAVGPNVFRRLIVAAPEALSTLDPVDGFYPFQMAALLRHDNAQKGSAERMQLTAIFTLLVGAPDLLVAVYS